VYDTSVCLPTSLGIERISPEMKDEKPTSARWVPFWVPFAVQLVYRDAQGRAVKTENYASRQLDPVRSSRG
jgi:hypothetical protein